MIQTFQTLIRTGELAKELGVDGSTLNRWTHNDPRFRKCLFRRGFYSIQRLREAGIVATPEAVKS